MASWIECKTHGVKPDRTIFVNLDQVVSLSGDDNGTVVRYAGGKDCEFVVVGSPQDLLKQRGRG